LEREYIGRFRSKKIEIYINRRLFDRVKDEEICIGV